MAETKAKSTKSKKKWDHTVDVLVVGSGNGAMTAALCLYEMGCKDVLLIEKSDKYGGTSSVSGGGVWVPLNRYAVAAGADDSMEEARKYLHATIPEDMVPREMLDVYLENAPKMVDFLASRTRVEYISLEGYPDYYTDNPGARDGHRSMEPAPIHLQELKDEAQHLTPTHPMMSMMSDIGITQVEARVLTGRLDGWVTLAMKRVFQGLWLRFKSFFTATNRRLTCGSAGVARLRVSLMDRSIPLWLETPMKELVVENDKVVGVKATHEGKPYKIQARKGVILACGGFEHNQKKREKYLPKPTNTLWSAGVHSNTGDGIWSAMDIGAKTRDIDGAWWCTTIQAPGKPRPWLSVMEKCYPGCFMVNPAGKRYANESQNYMSFQMELFDLHNDKNPCVPTYMIFDRNFRKKYVVGPLMTARLRPDWRLPKQFFDDGILAIASSIKELAEKVGIDADGLTETVERFNGFAKTGKDLDFQRGDTVYDRYYGDPRVTPNPCLGPVEKPPFYALRVDPGDFGTRGGVVTDEHARVINENDEVIPNLYATGNCSVALLPNYPGPGATLGPAMAFAYQAAKDLTGYKD